jgi:ferredoxin-NADP reductase
MNIIDQLIQTIHPSMGPHRVKVLEAYFITPNVKKFVLQKPSGFSFQPGQAAHISIGAEGWEDKIRQFTFTGLPKWEHLELLVKIYKGRGGVTEQLGKTNAGAELIIHDVFGAMQYKGPGVFISGGSGITPFISIFRELNNSKRLLGNKLIYSNYTSQDVICGAEFHDMLKENYINHYTRENVIGFREKRLNPDLLVRYIGDFSQRFYVCGSESFVTDISAMLLELGATADALVIEAK